ncbi:MAG TPA: EamA family transporter [Streptosporangiaceae bacterium]|jgi:drug/metabolite transporter (DMT)-like permease
MGDQHLTARAKAWGLGLAVVSTLCFGSSGAFAKALINAGLTPLQAVWLRVAGAALVLVPLTLVLRGTAGFRAARRSLPPLLLFGAAGVAGCQAFYFVAASRLPVGVAILLEYTGPVMVVGWLRFVRRARVARSAALGVAVALAGVACVVQIWAGLRLDGVGLLAGLGAAAAQAAYFLVAERMGGETDPLVLTSAGFVVGAVVLTVVAAPWSIPWGLLPADVAFADQHAPAWLIAAWIVVVSTVIAYITSVLAVRRLSAPVAAAVSYPEAVFAALFAWVILGERLTPVQLVGGLIVLAGAFIAQRAVSTKDPVAAAPSVPAPAPLAAR